MYKGGGKNRVDHFHRALEALTGMGAIESRKIQRTLYYAFHQEVDLAAWEPIG